MAKIRPLQVRKLADKSGDRDPETGAWPFAGLAIEGEAPRTTRVATSFVQRGRAEGWIEVENEQIVHRPGGPPEDLWRVTNTFQHVDVVILKTTDGDVRYRVTHQPDKYADPGTDATPVTDEVYAEGATRVDWFYDLELEG